MSKESFKNSIELELSKSTNELSKKLESCRIDILEIIPPPEIAWEIKDDDSEEFNILGTHGNFKELHPQLILFLLFQSLL